jgi:ATP-dependent Clp protease protease subunit
MKFKKINDHFFPGKEDINQSYIYLHGEIDHESTSPIIEGIIASNLENDCDCKDPEECDCEEKEDVINLLICSPGGDATAALSLIAVIEASEIPIRTISLGECGSAALMIFISGHQRVLTPYTSILSHQFWSGTEGSFSGLQSAMVEFNNYHEKIVKLYTDKTGLDRKYVEKYLLKDTDSWLTPDQALDHKLADIMCDLK